jgi:hypothetical protein
MVDIYKLEKKGPAGTLQGSYSRLQYIILFYSHHAFSYIPYFNEQNALIQIP